LPTARPTARIAGGGVRAVGRSHFYSSGQPCAHDTPRPSVCPSNPQESSAAAAAAAGAGV